MYFFLILFFISLSVITFMISRKVLSLNNSTIPHPAEENFIAPVLDSNKIKHSLKKGFRDTLHLLIWMSLKAYILSTNFLKKKSAEIWTKIKVKMEGHKKNVQNELTENKQPSKYLNLISEYREKIRVMKHRIKEEEGIE